MTFQRQATDKWRGEIPGARWFKADLHIHTIDDHPGRRAKMPPGLSGDPAHPRTLADYARRFLQALIERGVQVAGLTPHAPRAGDGPETSAVWKIVEEWNAGTDDDGTPFREKIYAVLPGFEPSFREGRKGLHLLFLFDPEIGRERYLTVFDLVMGGVSPWRDGALQVSGKRADEAFAELKKLRERELPAGENGDRAWNSAWDSLVLAPHIDADNGLLGAQKSQVLQLFDHGAIAALELGDGKLPEDTLQNRPWLGKGMETHRQAFFHASDAYGLGDMGRRHAWIKLASPRVEALRQAFIASDSRVRIGFERGEDGALHLIADPPDVTSGNRPWLREATVRGGASFFGGRENDGPRETRFRLSPDLTCVIGGSMTGKSTLLDGLRVHTGARLPDDTVLRGQVEARGRRVFGAETPGIDLDCPGTDPIASFDERWPAQFFTQNELQRLSQEGAAVEDILARLVSSETGNIESRNERLRDLDAQLSDCVRQLRKLDEQLADMEQACERARAAKGELAAFAEAGVEGLQHAGRDRQLWTETGGTAESIARSIRDAAEAVATVGIPQIDAALAAELASRGHGSGDPGLGERWARIEALLRDAEREVQAWGVVASAAAEISKEREAGLRAAVEHALAERGLDAVKLKEMQDLNRRASLLSSYETELERIEDRRAKTEKSFANLQQERHTVIDEQRQAFERVAQGVERQFEGGIRVRRMDGADTRPLEDFLKELRQGGVTRWWNDLDPAKQPSPDRLVACLDADSLAELGMSPAVQERFRESVTRSKRRQLAALRCPDRYLLELRMDDASYRSLNDLSGGQRVSVLLSLLLETEDTRPLVIDQPEDELDNRFLFDTVLPALRKLRGRRQVIVATHNANVVVNGDADMVIQLDATARRGRVACAGAIEEPAVRDAILRTVDGGKEAFRLRRRKYGF